MNFQEGQFMYAKRKLVTTVFLRKSLVLIEPFVSFVWFCHRPSRPWLNQPRQEHSNHLFNLNQKSRTFETARIEQIGSPFRYCSLEFGCKQLKYGRYLCNYHRIQSSFIKRLFFLILSKAQVWHTHTYFETTLWRMASVDLGGPS